MNNLRLKSYKHTYYNNYTYFISTLFLCEHMFCKFSCKILLISILSISYTFQTEQTIAFFIICFTLVLKIIDRLQGIQLYRVNLTSRLTHEKWSWPSYLVGCYAVRPPPVAGAYPKGTATPPAIRRHVQSTMSGICKLSSSKTCFRISKS